MKFNIFKSNYSWNETITRLNSEQYDEIKERVIEDIYYEFDPIQFPVHEIGEDEELASISIKVFIKRKIKTASEWQFLFSNILNNELDDFMPMETHTFDGILMIKNNNNANGEVFLMSFGQSFHRVNKLIDPNFGIDFAERTIKKDNVKIKNVSFYQQNKLKEISNYRRKNGAIAKATESFSYISGNPELPKKYGKTINCGTGIAFNISLELENFSKKICQLIPDIEEALRGRILNDFPRLKILSTKSDEDKDKILILDNKLLSEFIHEEKNSNIVDISLIFEIKNSLFILDEQTSVNLFIKSNKLRTETLLIDEDNEKLNYIDVIKKFLLDNKVTDLNVVQLEISSDDAIKHILDLKDILHAEIVYRDKKYLLQNGYWGIFNKEYFKLLNSYLTQIDLKLNKLSESAIEFEQEEESYIFKLQEKNCDDYKVVHKHFIKPIDNSFIIKGNGLELADLYHKEKNELFTVKKGIKTSLSLYSLEQSMLSIEAISDLSSYNLSGLNEVLTTDELKNIPFSKKASIIWLLPLKKSDKTPINNFQHTNNVLNEKFDLKQLGSILLKNKLVSWAQFSIENKMSPTIYMECPIDLNS